MRSDTFVFDESGGLLVEIAGLTCKRVAGSHRMGEREWYEPRLELAPLEGALRAEVRQWIAFASEEPSAALAEAIRAAFPGTQGEVVTTPASGAIGSRLAGMPLDQRTHILLVVGGARASEDVVRVAQSEAVNLLEIAKTLAASDGVPALTLLTRGGCSAPEDSGVLPDLAASPLYAAARVLRNELPKVFLRVVDVPDADDREALAALTAEIAHVCVDQTDEFVVLRGSKRFVRKLQAVDPDAARRLRVTPAPARGGSYRLEPETEGSLDPFVAVSTDPRAPDRGEVEIEVHAAGVNFKDVMNAMGLLSDRAVGGGLAGKHLGLEVAGRVRRVGPGVAELSPGQRVMARVVGGFAGCVVANADLVTPIPSGLTCEEAAALPVVYLTAHYALSHLARLQRDEWVLVHSGAGGVGVAAIALARRLGAKVLATAGSPERRAYVTSLGADAVFDSRSSAFYDGVMSATGGRGVDVVLNSLTGRLLNQSVRCLAPFGRFVEIGKTDIYRNARLGLERLGDNASFFAVDVDRLASQKPALHKELMGDLARMFERRELTPPRVSTTPAPELGKALKALSRAHVTGKAVVTMDEGSFSVLPRARLELRPDRTYLVTGGTDGFGLEVARFLFERGARHLVLVSRSGPKLPEDAEAIAALERAGAQVRVEKVDVGDEGGISQLLDSLEMPLAGVVHAAGVLDDGRIPEMAEERFARVFRPKAVGAWNLHQQTIGRGLTLEFFVMLSSISSVLGLYGQFGYAAANEFLDGLAAHRQALGLPAVSINLGVLGEYAGMSRRSESTAAVLDALEAVGLTSMTLPETLSGIECAILHGVPQRMVARVDWKRFGTAYPHLQRQSEFIERFAATPQNGTAVARSAGLRDFVAALPKHEQAHALATKLRDALARILGIESERFSVDEQIDKLALDSLTLVQLRSFILREWDAAYPLIRLLAGPSLLEVSEDLLGGNISDSTDTNTAPAGVLQTSSSASPSTYGFSHLSPWIVRGRSTGLERVRLVCFHAMGAGASLFAPLLVEPPEGMDILAVQSPGRETRSHEPFVTNVADVVSAALEQLDPLLDRRFVFWGHSFGGIVAFEAIRALLRARGPLPAHLVVTGSIAPQLVHQWQRRGVLLRALVQDNSPEYLLSLARYVENPEFVRGVLPLMRRDAPILLDYRYEDEEPLPVPVTAFAARQDDMVYLDEVEPWKTQTTAHFRLVEVEGDHWFLHRHRALLRKTLADIAVRSLRESGIELRAGAEETLIDVA
jgi:NADPH:quinone reductase-like Zn-dependent oxidoreductase/surfactin synthase thioesterase subunit